MKTSKLQVKPIAAVLSLLAFVAVVAMSPHAFAQQPFQGGQGQQNGIALGSSYNAPAGSTQNQIPAQVVYSDSDNPTGPLQGMGWGIGMAIVGVMSGVGVWTAVRSR
ncbi:MAG: hypothetical protein WAN47_02120 [Nitrosotalea sp.]